MSTLNTPSTSGTSSSSSRNVNETIGIPSTPERHAFRSVDIEGCENGYDSNGQHAPCLDINPGHDDELMTEEEPLPAVMTHSSPPPEPIINPNLTNTSNISDKLTNDDVMKMKVAELKDS